MPSFCVVVNCELKYTHSENISFHKFPLQQKDLLEQWIEFTSRGKNWKPSRWSAICSRHFLPTDFRTANARKCLKKDAVPSVKVHGLNAAITEKVPQQQEDKLSDNCCDANCRLCGICCRSVATFFTNFEIFGMIQKCFPTLNIQQDDNLPKDMCSTCLERLKSFSEFVDDVLQTQKELQEKYQTERNSKTLNSERQLKIKQEPVVKVKQEVSDGFQSFLSDDFDDDQDCEQKLPFYDFPALNAQDIINNCDIMEIINLDDPFIDIPDDETGILDEKFNQDLLLKESIMNTIREEHNYQRNVEENEAYSNILKKIYKTESEEESEKLSEPAKSLNAFQFPTETPTTSSKPIFTAVHNFLPVTNEALISFSSPSSDQQKINFNPRTDSTKTQPEVSKPNIVVINESIVKPGSGFMELFTSDRSSTHHPFYPISLPISTPLSCIPFQEDERTEPKRAALPEVTQKSQFVCKSCPLTFNSSTELLKHKAKAHFRKRQKRTMKTLFCPVCHKHFVSKLALSNHIKFICDFKHQQQNLIFGCEYCAKIFNHWRLLKQHERNCKRAWKVKKDGPGPLTSMPKQKKRGTTEEKASATGAENTCKECGKQFKTSRSLEVHLIRHTGKKTFVCLECGKAFACLNNLYQHRITHSVEKRHKCDMCDKVFKRRGGLTQHKKGFHMKLKTHECPVCKYRYALKGDMMRCRHSSLKNLKLGKELFRVDRREQEAMKIEGNASKNGGHFRKLNSCH